MRERGFSDEASLRAWLTEQGVTGYPQRLLVWERFGYPDYLTASVVDLIEGQYADRPHLRPVLDALLDLASGIGEATVQARKTYVSLLTPRRTFAAVQPTTKQRVDLGLRLAGVKPVGRLERAKSFPQGSVTMKIGLSSPDEVDREVERWLREAYRQNA